MKIITKICAILSIILAIISIVIVYNSPSAGYESSIYSSINQLLWFSIIALIIIGLIIVLIEIHKNEYLINKSWAIGFYLVFFAYVLSLSVFMIKGYYIWNMGGDSGTHIGYVKEIFNNGVFANELYYPILHIFLTEVTHVSNMDIIFLHKFIPYIFGVLFVPFVYILSRYILYNKGQAIIVSTLSCAFIFNSYLNLAPIIQSNMLFPIVLFTIFKYIINKKLSWGAISIILLLIYPPLHIIPTLVLILILITIGITNQAFIYVNKLNIKSPVRLEIVAIILLSIITIVWISSFNLWNDPISDIYEKVVDVESESSQMSQTSQLSQISTLSEKVSYASSLGYNPLEFAFKLYGGALIIMVGALIFAPIVFIDMYKNKKIYVFSSLYGPIVILSMLFISLYFFNMAFGPLRIIYYILLLCIVITGYGIWSVLRYLKAKSWGWNSFVVIGLISLLLISIFVNGIFILYPSPYTGNTNYQTTHYDEKGMMWFLDKKSDHSITVNVYSVGQSKRYNDLFIGPNKVKPGTKEYVYEAYAPYHFGYYTYNDTTKCNDYNIYSLNTTIIRDVINLNSYYLITTEKDKTIYTDIFPKIAKYRFYPDDFELLEKDPLIDSVYSNGEFDVWALRNNKLD